MTVSYSLNVSKATFGGFARLLFRWKGSIFKSLWRESLLFCTLYVLINTTYRHALDQVQKNAFAEVVKFGKYFMDVIPFYFIVGFYVTTVTGRWIGQFIELPWPDRVIHMIASFVHGSDDRSRMIRRSLARYIVLLQILTFQTVSTAVRRRFPTTQHLVVAGIMTAEERSVYEKVDFAFGKWWLPCHWFMSLATRAKKEDRIKDSVLIKALFEEAFKLRNNCAAMIGYDWIGVPLAYTQVATIATYLYALVLLVGTQSIETPKHLIGFTADYYFPFVTVWRFFFSVGWLKVAEQLLNPYGEDDDDFELNWCLDRALVLAYDVVDTHHMMHPKVKKDAFWDIKDIRLPQTVLSAKYMRNPELGSAVRLEIEEADYLPMDELCEKDDEDNRYRNPSLKKNNAGRQNSSFIRRVLNSGFAQSFHKKSRKTDVGRSVSCKTGFSNAAFSMGDENDDVSNKSTPSESRKSSKANLVKKTSPIKSSVKFKKLSQKKQKSYLLEETELSDRVNHKSADSNVGISQKTKLSRISKSHQTASTDTQLVERNSARNDVGENPEEQGEDALMPSIPEEFPRVNSLASLELISVAQKDGKSSQQSRDRSQDLVAEVSEKLLVYRESTSAPGRRKESDGKGYVSCCSNISSEELSEDSLDGSENAPRRKDNETICVVIEEQLGEKDASRSGEPMHT